MQPALLTLFLLCHDDLKLMFENEIVLPGLPNRAGKHLAIKLLKPILVLTRTAISL